LAKIETDKASIDFEAQDDGFIAKILMEAGSGEDIQVGVPIMVTVEESEDVAAFSDFVVEPEQTTKSTETTAAAEAPPPPPPPPPTAAPAPIDVEEAPPVPPPIPTVAEVVAAPETAETVAPVLSTNWGNFAKLNSPLLSTLSKQQNEYMEKYGTTGQVPI